MAPLSATRLRNNSLRRSCTVLASPVVMSRPTAMQPSSVSIGCANYPGYGGVAVDASGLQQRRLALDHQGFCGQFALRRLHVDRDLDLLHTWMNDPEVARFWRMPWPRDRGESYLRGQDGSTHSTPYLGELDGSPISYWELYRAD